jgi:hypothetical protein
MPDSSNAQREIEAEVEAEAEARVSRGFASSG